MTNHEEQNQNSNPVQNFFGRTDIFEKIYDILSAHKKNSIVLYGAPCMGKTSILKELLMRLPEVGKYYPLYYNLKHKSVEPPEVEGIELDRSLLENFSVNAISNSFLEELSDPLPPGTSLILLLDEFDSLETQYGDKAFSQVKEVIECDQEQIQFIFAVDPSNEELCALIENIESCCLTNLSRKEVEQIVQSMGHSLNWKQEALDSIWNLTQGHPYLVKHLCAVIIKQAKQGNAVEYIDIEEVKSEFVKNADTSSMSRLWGSLSDADREVNLLYGWFFKHQKTGKKWSKAYIGAIFAVCVIIIFYIIFHILSLQNTIPASVLKISSPPIKTWLKNNTITITWNPVHNKDIAGYSYIMDTYAATDPDNTAESALTSFTSPPLADATNHYFHICIVNNAGNTTNTTHAGPFYIDAAPPSKGSISINSNAETANSVKVTLDLRAADDGCGMGKMRFSNDKSNWSEPETYAESANWSLLPGEGKKTVYAQFSDALGNWTTTDIYDDITLKDDIIPESGNLSDMIQIDKFYIDKYEVDIASYEKIFSGKGNKNADKNMPITNVSWEDASNYAKRIGKRLCTKDEWKKAFVYKKNAKKGSAIIDGNPQPVKTEGDVSDSGVYNMIGNVSEWIVNNKGKSAVIGKSFMSGNTSDNAADSFSLFKENSENHIGFRLCKDAE